MCAEGMYVFVLGSRNAITGVAPTVNADVLEFLTVSGVDPLRHLLAYDQSFVLSDRAGKETLLSRYKGLDAFAVLRIPSHHAAVTAD